MRSTLRLLAGGLLLVALGCEFGPRSGRGLRLPDGDEERGAVAFRELGCPKCHDVVGGPEATLAERADVIVELGGEVSRVETYGELVTSIVNPSHELSVRYPREAVSEDGESKMENFNDRMTVAQLIDLTAFLQSRYRLRPEPLMP